VLPDMNATGAEGSAVAILEFPKWF
jgi:hypothetical protein